MKREIAIADLHGCLNQLMELVEDVIQFNPDNNDRLIFLGDFLDRGANSRVVIEYVSNLKELYPDSIELLMGNHELMALDALTEGVGSYEDAFWKQNGGNAVLKEFANRHEAKAVLLKFIETLKPYIETEDAIYVHGGIPKRRTLETATIEELLWHRRFDYTGSKLVVCGHTPHSEVTHYGNIVCVDTGCYITGKLSAYDVITGTVYEVQGEAAVKNPEEYMRYLKDASQLQLV